MKILIVEDEFGSRKVMQKFLSPYGVCDLAVDGEEGIKAFTIAMQEKKTLRSYLFGYYDAEKGRTIGIER